MDGKTSQNEPQVEQPHYGHGCDENPEQEGNQDEDDELRGGEGGWTGREDWGAVGGVQWSRDISSSVELGDCLTVARDLEHQ